MDSREIFEECMKVVAERQGFSGEYSQRNFWKSAWGERARILYQEVAEEYAKRMVSKADKAHHDLQKRMTQIQNSSRDD